MRVLLVGNYPLDAQESMLRFAGSLRDGLESRGCDVRLVFPPALIGSGYASGSAGKWLAYLDKFLLFAPSLSKAAHWADVIHICDHSNAMYANYIGGKPLVVTCHDMLAVRGALGEQTDCPASWSGVYLQKWILAGLRKAQMIACVSTATEADVRRLVHSNSQTVTTIHNGLHYPYAPLNGSATSVLAGVDCLDLRRPFILHVGQNHPRKNRAGVIRAFALAQKELPSLQLVLAGPPLNSELQELIRAERLDDHVIVAVRPSNETLEALYSSALCLLFPSRFEGFGWPLIEAQACACPVVCSRCAPFEEIVGETAIMRDADDVRGLASDVVQLANDPAKRARLIALGIQNARRFTPQQMVSGYIALYERLLNRKQELATSTNG